jgi:LacI family transcriptional regulator
VGVVERLSTDVLAIEDPVVARAVAFISDHARDGINAQDVVKALGLARFRLDAAFKARRGRSLYAEILHFRLEHARRLISTTGLPLKQIAGAVGFRSVQHMSGLFRAAYKHPPAAYRRTVASLKNL